MVPRFKNISRATFRLRVNPRLMRLSIKILTSKHLNFIENNSNMNESYNESSSVLIGEKSIDH